MVRYLKSAFLIIALSLVACAAEPTHDQSLSEQGLNAMQEGNMLEAERLLTDAVSEDPNNLQALLNLGSIYRQTDRPGMAREYYQRVIDGEAAAVQNGQDPEEAAKLAQVARDNIAQMDQEEAMRQEAIRQEMAAAAELAAKEAALRPPPPVEPEPVPAPVVQYTGYRIQTGAYAVVSNAESMRDLLTRRHANLIKGRQVRLVKVGGLTKVQLGPYNTLHEADSACHAFKRAGIDCFRIK